MTVISWQLGVELFGDIDDDIAAVALGPAFLPKVAGHFGDLVDLAFQFRIII